MLRRLIPVLGVAAVLAGLSPGQEGPKLASPTSEFAIAQAPKKEGPEPKTPAVEPKTPKVDPKTPKVDPKSDAPPPADPPIMDLLAGGGAGTAAGQSRTGESTTHAPNMYGDAFGASRTQFSVFLGSLRAESRVQDNTLGTDAAANNPNQRFSKKYPAGAGNGIVVVGNATQARQSGIATTPGVNYYELAAFPNASPQFKSTQNARGILLAINAANSRNRGATVSFPIEDNPEYGDAADSVFNMLYGNRGVTYFLPDGSRVDYRTRITDEGGVTNPGVVDIGYLYERYALMDLALPAGGGVVGRTKIAEDNNPLPRDRLIFGYDYFNNTRLTAGGFDVHRFAPGFEVTFLDQLASVQLVMPFASTISPISDGSGITNRDTVFGNLFAAVKGLVYSEDTLHLAAGAGVAFPTSPDTVVKSFNGDEFLRIKNESVNVVPFVAAIFTPTTRFYWQNWASMNFDITSSPVQGNLDGMGARPLGRLRDQSVLALDTQIGYWLITPGSGDGFIQGLTPFLELHYNTTVSNGARVGPLVATNNRYDEINLTTGLAMYMEDNLLVSASLVTPLSSDTNRFFNYQFGLRMSLFFGPTAANREALRYGR